MMSDKELARIMREIESHRFVCQHCKRSLAIETDLVSGEPSEGEGTCYDCIAAFHGVLYGDCSFLHWVKNPEAHIQAIMPEIPDGFRCGFCAHWREHWCLAFNDCGVAFCATCADALDALRDGAADALAIWRGESG